MATKEKYNGWNLMEEVIIVSRECTEYNRDEGKHVPTGKYQGFVVDSTNKKQLETAKVWAEGYSNKDNAKSYVYPNDGFILNLLDSAENSSQGGKLSFWNCLITRVNDDKEFIVGINADLLLDLLLNSVFIEGQCQTEVVFARKNGSLGIIHKYMKAYEDALKDAESKKIIKSKTSKHVVGRNYFTLNENQIYLGVLYDWFEPVIGTVNRGHWCGTRQETMGYRIAKQPVKKYIFKHISEADIKEKTIKDFIYNQEEREEKSGGGWQKGRYSVCNNLVDKLPSRTQGNICLENNMSEDDWDDYLKGRIGHLWNKCAEHRRTFRPTDDSSIFLDGYDIQRSGLSAYADKPPQFTNEEIKMLGNYFKK